MINPKISFLIPFIFFKVIYPLINESSLGETIKRIEKPNRFIDWEETISEDVKHQTKEIEWEEFDENLEEIYKNLEENDKNIFKPLGEKDKKEIIDADPLPEFISDSKKDPYQLFTEIEPFFPVNEFLSYGEWQSSIRWKSSFDGGASGGTGQQNPSFVFDYGLSDNSLITIYITGADDELYNFVDNQKVNYYWQSYAISLKKQLLKENKYNLGLSMVSTIEYWRMASGSKTSKSIFNQTDDVLGKDKFELLVGAFSLPFSKRINEKMNLFIVPGITFLPESVGSKAIVKNSYGNNIYLGTGFKFNLFDNSNLFATYTNPLGPGNNYFDDNLNYSRKSIYSFGFAWNVNPKITLEGKVTNSYGSSPSTGLLTIPSDNLTLYSVNFNYKPYEKDTFLRSFSEREKILSHGGITVNNAYLPEAGVSKVKLNYDSKGNLFGSYSYSLSNIFQLDLINIGNFKTINSNNYADLRSTYLNNNNLNYRIGGKLLISSRRKNDLFDTAIKTSVGRNQNTNQGYLFTELINTFKLNKWLHLNLNPKYIYSGVESFGAIGISSNIDLSNNLQLIPELNKTFNNTSELTSTIALRYAYEHRKSIDFYISNAAGIQDVGQIIKNKDYKFGINLNFTF